MNHDHDHELAPAGRLAPLRHRIVGAIRRLFGPVDIVTVHHEGAGDPSNTPRGAGGGYTVWIGPTVWTKLRTAWVSFATLDFNHRSYDVCLSGDRRFHPVTDQELVEIHRAFMDGVARGEVTPRPSIRRQHKNSPGSTTVCACIPDDRFNAVAAALSVDWQPVTPPNPPQPPPPPPDPGDTGMIIEQPGRGAGPYKSGKIIGDSLSHSLWCVDTANLNGSAAIPGGHVVIVPTTNGARLVDLTYAFKRDQDGRPLRDADGLPITRLTGVRAVDQTGAEFEYDFA